MKFCAEKYQKLKNFDKKKTKKIEFQHKFYKFLKIFAKNLIFNYIKTIKKRNKNETTDKRINYIQPKRYERQN